MEFLRLILRNICVTGMTEENTKRQDRWIVIEYQPELCSYQTCNQYNNQQDALFSSTFILINSLYMF
jgi:hypothetical protein